MKKILLATAFLFATVAMAQNGQPATDAKKAPAAKHHMMKKEKHHVAKKKFHKKWKAHKKAKKESKK